MSENLVGVYTLVGSVCVLFIGVAIITFINKRQKVKTLEARVISKEIDNPGITSQTGIPKFYVKFSVQEKGNEKVAKYKINEKCYNKISEQKKGVLTIQGTELLSFACDGQVIDFN